MIVLRDPLLCKITEWEIDNDRELRYREERWFNTFNRVGRFFGHINIDRHWFQVATHQVGGTCLPKCYRTWYTADWDNKYYKLFPKDYKAIVRDLSIGQVQKEPGQLRFGAVTRYVPKEEYHPPIFKKQKVVQECAYTRPPRALIFFQVIIQVVS